MLKIQKVSSRILLCSTLVLGAGMNSNTLRADDKPAPVTEPTAENIIKRLDKLERLLQSQGLLDMLQQLDSLQTEMNTLRGNMEVQNHTLEQLGKRQQEIYTDLDRRLQRLESGSNIPGLTSENAPPLEVMPPAQETATVIDNGDTEGLTIEQVEPPSTTTGETDNESTSGNFTPTKTMPEPVLNADPETVQAEYQQAFSLLKQSRYDEAIEKFGEFLGKYPDSEYSDNAQYWRGEAYYVTQRYQEAISEYNKLVSLYPDSQKVTHGLLKMGYSHHQLGQIDEAKKTLNDLKQYYPGTTAARLADDRLRQISATP